MFSIKAKSNQRTSTQGCIILDYTVSTYSKLLLGDYKPSNILYIRGDSFDDHFTYENFKCLLLPITGSVDHIMENVSN